MRLIIQSIIVIVLVMAIISSLSYLSSVYADKGKDLCYDQVGDGHLCFKKESTCNKVQKHDEIAESPYYNQDSNWNCYCSLWLFCWIELFVTAMKNNTRIASEADGIIISVIGLSNENISSRLSYIKKPQNRENAPMAYFNFFISLLVYAEIDNDTKIRENAAPAA